MEKNTASKKSKSNLGNGYRQFLFDNYCFASIKDSKLTAEEESSLFAVLQDPCRSQKEKQEAQDRILLGVLDTIFHVSYKRYKHSQNTEGNNFYQGYVSADDIISVGMEGAMEALAKFSPQRGNRFSTYARYWIKKHIGEYLDANGTTKMKISGPVVEKNKRILNQLIAQMEGEMGNQIPMEYEEIAHRSGLTLRQVKKGMSAPVKMTPISLDADCREDDEEGACIGDFISDSEVTAADELYMKEESRDRSKKLVQTFLTKHCSPIEIAVFQCFLDSNCSKSKDSTQEIARECQIPPKKVLEIIASVCKKMKRSSYLRDNYNKIYI